ncbi:hypothetical protein Tsubulata_031184 [Turnera subulata]|uniref:(S)-hydroxynitrile lyase n=1 Tax=Turnera subulata TaxID=218843 RepID=A0A9Q0F9E1_9ROSI|nr:hypothetical protein Tsubulata_031184 [Turnera subulata]
MFHNASKIQGLAMKGQHHFVLVHGSCHGAWCWYKVASLLKSAGHRVTALDQAASGVNPKQVQDLHSSVTDYLEPLLIFLMSLEPEERVILVGHSMGGLNVAIAMERFPQKISAAVFVAGIMPGPDLGYRTARKESRFHGLHIRFWKWAWQASHSHTIRAHLHGNKVVPDLELAMSMVRPYPFFSHASTEANAVFTKEKYGSVARAYIVCDQDKTFEEDLQRWMIENNPPDEVKVISGSDHMVISRLASPSKTASQIEGLAMEGQHHFVLVHGACHGVWCWDKVATLLKSAGHRVTALDQGASGDNPKQLREIRSVSDYLEPLMVFLMSLEPEQRVILVGHSMGGLDVAIAMERFPERISAAVFVAGIMPGPDLSFSTASGEDLELAMSMVRPYPSFSYGMEENAVFTKEKYGSVARAYIVCDQDKVFEEDLQRWMIENNPPDEVKVISGSDHMVMPARVDQDYTREYLVMEGKQKHHFVLVHGACHGAWCWYKVATLLKSGGHRVTALDQGACGVNPKQVQDLHSFSDYMEPLMAFLMSLKPEESVILVGHSMGGLSVAISMEKFPQKISAAVFVAAFMPGPDLSYSTARAEYDRRIDSYMDSTFVLGSGPGKPPTAILFGPDFMATTLYQLSPAEDLELAMSLVRPFPFFRDASLLEENGALFTKEKYGSVARAYIVCDQDKILEEDLQKWMIENNRPDDVKPLMGHGVGIRWHLSLNPLATKLLLLTWGLQVHHLKSFSDYVEPLMEFMSSLPQEEKIILVGHSYGGYCVSVAMEKFSHKISAAVYVAAFMPGPQLSFAPIQEEHTRRVGSFMDYQYLFSDGPENPPTTFIVGPEFASTRLYQLSPVEDLELAMMSMRPFPWFSDEEIRDKAVLTKEKYGSVPRAYIICDQDNIIKEDFQRWMIENYPTDETKLISNTDHMVMVCKPKELCSSLLEIAEKFQCSA